MIWIILIVSAAMVSLVALSYVRAEQRQTNK